MILLALEGIYTPTNVLWALLVVSKVQRRVSMVSFTEKKRAQESMSGILVQRLPSTKFNNGVILSRCTKTPRVQPHVLRARSVFL